MIIMAFIGNISTELLFIYQLKNSNQIKCWLMRRGENWSIQGKNPWCRVKNQQTQPTYEAESTKPGHIGRIQG